MSSNQEIPPLQHESLTKSCTLMGIGADGDAEADCVGPAGTGEDGLEPCGRSSSGRA